MLPFIDSKRVSWVLIISYHEMHAGSLSRIKTLSLNSLDTPSVSSPHVNGTLTLLQGNNARNVDKVSTISSCSPGVVTAKDNRPSG